MKLKSDASVWCVGYFFYSQSEVLCFLWLANLQLIDVTSKVFFCQLVLEIAKMNVIKCKEKTQIVEVLQFTFFLIYARGV